MQVPPLLWAFEDGRLLAVGDPAQIALRLTARPASAPPPLVLDAWARPVDLDLSGEAADVAARYASAERPAPQAEAPAPPARGRPRLGVVAREVTLLPRHWAWLNSQPGGASAALRRLVESARKSQAPADALRQRQEAAYRAMVQLAGDRPGFEAAARALFAQDTPALESLLAAWPADIGAYVRGRLDLSEPAPS